MINGKPGINVDVIEKLVHRCLDADPNTRSSAVNLLFQRVNSYDLHPADLRVTVANGSSAYALIEQLRDRINDQHRELDFLRSNVSPEVLARAIQAQRVTYRWPDLLEYICTRITGDDPEIAITTAKLTPGWKVRLRAELQVSPGVLSRWEEGTEQIPQRVFDHMESMSLAPTTPTRRKPAVVAESDTGVSQAETARAPRQRARKSGSDGFWTQEKYVRAFELLQADKGLKDAGAEIGANYNQMSGMYGNQPPREEWFGVIPIGSAGTRMTYLELWKIGHGLHGQGWKTKLTNLLGLPHTAFQFNDPDRWLSMDVCDRLRDEYRMRKAVKSAGDTSIWQQGELDALMSLWPSELGIQPTRRFIITHVQVEMGSLNEPSTEPKRRGDLRERYHEEIKCRRVSERYLHMSRGLALLEKRTDKQLSGSEFKSDMTGAMLRSYGETWFGDGSHVYLGQLIGYAGTYIKGAYEGKKDVTTVIKQVVQDIAQCVSDLDLTDPACEAVIAARVSALGGSL